MNSQSKDPAIAAAEAVAKDDADPDAVVTSDAEAPADAAVPLREERRARGGATRGQRLREIKGGRGQGPNGGGGMGRGARALASEAEAFVPAPADDPPPAQPAFVPMRPRQMAATMTARQPVGEAQIRPRHRGIMALAFALIVLPGIGSAVYLWGFAVDQYVSTAGFAIRSQSTTASPLDFLGAFGASSSSTSKDMDILYNFIGSQQLVEKLDRDLGIQDLFSKPENDPLFAYDTSGTIEDLVSYWSRMVHVEYDSSTGLMRLNVHAFTPQDAQAVAKAVLAESSEVVNRLAAVARDDTTRYAKEALAAAEAKLKDARAALTEFRIANNIVDPTIDVSAQASVIGSLTQQLVQAQIELAMLEKGAAAATDPRKGTLEQRIAIIQSRIAEEQEKVAASGGSGAKGYAEIIATFQRLSADLEFGEQAYLTALASHDVAVEEAQHQQVYLATYEEPTLAQAATSPQRWLILIAVMVIGFLTWSIVTLIYYALRDRR